MDLIQDAEQRSENVVALAVLLHGADRVFRKAVMETLVLEAFELDETLPNLQLPEEILQAIGNIKECGFGPDWDSFRRNLVMASKAGILVDLSSLRLQDR